jgi:glutamate N-acetyltransferase/amino-acid N-acetyltransferase
MPIAKIVPGIHAAAGALNADNGNAAARAIMTTDTRPKSAALRVTLPDGGVITLGCMTVLIGG